MKKLKKNYLGLPLFVSICVLSLAVIAIFIGSFLDLKISNGLYHKTSFGEFFEKYELFIPYFFYIFAGSLLFIAFKEKGKKVTAWGLFIIVYLYTMFLALNNMGSAMRTAFGYSIYNVWGPTILSIFYTFILFSWIMPISYFFIKKDNPKLLIKIASFILIAGIFSYGVNEFLKVFVSRPRYRYLITLKDDLAGFKNWWEFNPYTASNKNFQSFPSGHITLATTVCVLPFISKVFKYRFKYMEWVLFSLSFTFVVLVAYNRLHMGAHFFTDVSFAAFNTYGIFLVTYILIFKEDDLTEEKTNLALAKPKIEEKIVEKKEVNQDSSKNNSYKKGMADGEAKKLNEVIKNMNRGGLEAKRIAKLLKIDIIEVNEVLKINR